MVLDRTLDRGIAAPGAGHRRTHSLAAIPLSSFRPFTTASARAILTAGTTVVGEAEVMAEGFLGRLTGRGQNAKPVTAKFEVTHSEEEWRQRLSPAQYRV